MSAKGDTVTASSFRFIGPSQLNRPWWDDTRDFERVVDLVGAVRLGVVQSVADALRIAESAASFYRGHFRPPAGFWKSGTEGFTRLSWHAEYVSQGDDGISEVAKDITWEVERLAAEILAASTEVSDSIPLPFEQIAISLEKFCSTERVQMQATAVETLLMADGFLAQLAEGNLAEAMDWMSVAYKDLLSCAELASQIVGTPRDTSQRALSARHRENREMKAQIFEWLDDNRANYRSMDSAAEFISRMIVPITFRTARDWVAQWTALRSASRP